MHRTLIAITILLTITACGSPAPAAPAAPIEVTRQVVVTVPVEVTRLVEVTVPVEITRLVEPEVVATPEPAPAPAAQVARIALEAPITQNIGGVKLTIQHLVLTSFADASRDPDIRKLADSDAFAGAQILGILNLLLENDAAGKVNIYGDQGTIVIGSEQIELTSFMFYDDGDDLGGTFFPGVKSEGAIMFALKHTTWSDIAAGAKLIYEVSAPSDESYASLGEQPYHFELQLQPTK